MGKGNQRSGGNSGIPGLGNIPGLGEVPEVENNINNMFKM